MDNQDQNLGNSPGADGRGRLHTKISNTEDEPIPVTATVVIPPGIATSANQTNGNQKTQLVSGTGVVASFTGTALDVNITNGGTDSVSTFDQVSGVGTSSETTIVSYTVPVGQTFRLQIAEFSGTNIGEFNLYADAALIAQRRTNFGGNLTDQFDFATGIDFISGQVIALKTINPQLNPGDYSGRIQGTLV